MSEAPTNLSHSLSRQGYCIVRGALPGATLQAAVQRLRDQALAERRRNLAWEDSGPDQAILDEDGRLRSDAFTSANGGVNQRVWMLLNKGEVFRRIVLDETILSLVRGVLGKDLLLACLTANIARPGGVAMGLHTDQWWMPLAGDPADPPVQPGSITRTSFQEGRGRGLMLSPPMVVNVAFMLTDFTAENGATRIVPGSHVYARQPGPEDEGTDIPATGKAGDAMIFDGRLFHGTGANTTADEERIALLCTYCAPQVRCQENYTLGILPEVRRQASPELLSLLGFRVWNGYGRTGQPAEWATPGSEGLGELQP